MKLNGRKWLDEMEQRNSEKNQVFGTEWEMVFFACLILIPEQILLLNIIWVRRFFNKFQILTNIYVCIGIL